MSDEDRFDWTHWKRSQSSPMSWTKSNTKKNVRSKPMRSGFIDFSQNEKSLRTKSETRDAFLRHRRSQK